MYEYTYSSMFRCIYALMYCIRYTYCIYVLYLLYILVTTVSSICPNIWKLFIVKFKLSSKLSIAFGETMFIGRICNCRIFLLMLPVSVYVCSGLLSEYLCWAYNIITCMQYIMLKGHCHEKVGQLRPNKRLDLGLICPWS